ncbi:ribonuclease H-like domain-containing protein [Apodospora peruviana]|uniref:Ribonuclease H-like domain-containing protein n=1 Tax=Apodospora peruviana TaxID=516989 RepID=A0AAE0LZ32_9PEZI|nr:ribonuclease H-like domain-containing protein [Apodospora peruviana]
MSTATITKTTSIASATEAQDTLAKITNSMGRINLRTSAPGSNTLIDTPSAVSAMVDTLAGLPANPPRPSLYIDVEGINLSRQGSISILQIHVHPIRHTYLVDIHILGSAAFSTLGTTTTTTTLKSILESPDIPKVFFDVRNDSDALYHHFNISLQGIHDLQLMELATRAPTLHRRHLNGLARCIERDLHPSVLTSRERTAWKAAKERGLNLFAPERGGSYAVFNERPLREEIRSYCVQDVQFLPRLWACYNDKFSLVSSLKMTAATGPGKRISDEWRERVLEESKARVALSQTVGYNGKGKHMALAPLGW